MTRQVTINLTTGELTEIAMNTGSWEKLWHAIGYLSTWNDSYPYVNIWRDGKDAHLVAVYRDTETDRTYTIGAIWQQDHYGFHS
tara:strand:+ start:376 stop:627 length:252 start_codon:yes stop_codon:yes gene_type:complete